MSPRRPTRTSELGPTDAVAVAWPGPGPGSRGLNSARSPIEPSQIRNRVAATAHCSLFFFKKKEKKGKKGRNFNALSGGALRPPLQEACCESATLWEYWSVEVGAGEQVGAARRSSCGCCTLHCTCVRFQCSSRAGSAGPGAGPPARSPGSCGEPWNGTVEEPRACRAAHAQVSHLSTVVLRHAVTWHWTHTHLWPTDRPRALAPWDRRCGQERAGAGPCPHRTPIHGRKRLADVCHSGAAAGCSCERDPTRGRAPGRWARRGSALFVPLDGIRGGLQCLRLVQSSRCCKARSQARKKERA